MSRPRRPPRGAGRAQHAQTSAQHDLAAVAAQFRGAQAAVARGGSPGGLAWTRYVSGGCARQARARPLRKTPSACRRVRRPVRGRRVTPSGEVGKRPRSATRSSPARASSLVSTPRPHRQPARGAARAGAEQPRRLRSALAPHCVVVAGGHEPPGPGSSGSRANRPARPPQPTAAMPRRSAHVGLPAACRHDGLFGGRSCPLGGSALTCVAQRAPGRGLVGWHARPTVSAGPSGTVRPACLRSAIPGDPKPRLGWTLLPYRRRSVPAAMRASRLARCSSSQAACRLTPRKSPSSVVSARHSL